MDSPLAPKTVILKDDWQKASFLVEYFQNSLQKSKISKLWLTYEEGSQKITSPW